MQEIFSSAHGMEATGRSSATMKRTAAPALLGTDGTGIEFPGKYFEPWKTAGLIYVIYAGAGDGILIAEAFYYLCGPPGRRVAIKRA